METSSIPLLKKYYSLKQHPEGGWFSEVYTSMARSEGRAFSGSIYFLLDGPELSHFHQIDCEEIWYYHEGCGLKITMLFPDDPQRCEEYLLCPDIQAGGKAMVVIPRGAVFAAENLQKDSYTFMSCATSPAFRYEGFRLVQKEEILRLFPEHAEKVLYLAYE